MGSQDDRHHLANTTRALERMCTKHSVLCSQQVKTHLLQVFVPVIVPPRHGAEQCGGPSSPRPRSVAENPLKHSALPSQVWGMHGKGLRRSGRNARTGQSQAAALSWMSKILTKGLEEFHASSRHTMVLSLVG